jgi:hypothetical protein
MKNPFLLFSIILLCLAGYALYAAQDAFHRGERGLSFILIFIALIFWNRLQGKRS